MDKALYVNEGKVIQVNAYEISTLEYHDKYQGCLFCCAKGCSAQMVLVEQQKKEYKRFFRKLQGSKHKDGCLEDKGENVNKIVGGSEGINIEIGLSEKNIKDILEDTYKIATGSKKPKVPSNNGKTRKLNKVGEDKEKIKTQNIRLSPGGKGGNSEEKNYKHPPVYRKDVSSILISNDKNTYSVYGEVVNIEIEKEYAYITVVDKKNSFKLYMGEAFKVNNELAFNLLKIFEVYNDKRNKEGEKVLCTCICYKQKQREEYVGELLDIYNIRFDNKSLWQIRSIIEE